MQIDFKLFVQEKHVLLMKKQIISKFQRLEILNLGCKGKDSFVYTNLLVVYIH